ncbi:type II secretion protein F [Pseudactinotalea sp.]|uniref:type II secretion protein F n=1 Tax=Pseudactinotalea sp. TaxID=1926260 RepID=UPI003B3ABD9E
MRLFVVALLLLAGWVLTASGRPQPRQRRDWRGMVKGWRGRLRRSPRADVTRVLVEVATRLRAGTQLAEAWRRSLPEPEPPWAGEVIAASDPGGADVPGAAGVGMPQGRPCSPVRVRAGPPWQRRVRDNREAGDVAAAVAACRLAARTGAPLAEVIDVVVSGVAEAAEADELRRTALAGPRATARLLAWLPAGGIALGTVLGADPVAVLLGGGVGGLCLVGGGALFLVGNRWVRALVADAERAGR